MAKVVVLGWMDVGRRATHMAGVLSAQVPRLCALVPCACFLGWGGAWEDTLCAPQVDGAGLPVTT